MPSPKQRIDDPPQDGPARRPLLQAPASGRDRLVSEAPRKRIAELINGNQHLLHSHAPLLS
jgi:hypothetical protein